jgi:Rrf2 family protein
MLTRTAEHALRALLFLAQQPAGEVVPANRIAAATGAPRNYLAKTLQGLATAGLVRGTRGRDGGYVLAVPAGAITVGQVIAAFDTPPESGRCLLGDRLCAGEQPCVAHLRWQRARGAALQAMRNVRIQDLLAGLSLPEATPLSGAHAN